jgi:tRNA threonylcarbamoyladenosine biosynthesis protein TsaB
MILAINTSTLQFGLAFLQGDGSVLGEYVMSRSERHFGTLMPAFHFLLTRLKLDIHELKAVMVAKGPGSFTGLRVGLAAAKGLCQGLQIPIIGVSSLEAMASQLPCASIPIAPVLDSRKGEAFTALFLWSDEGGLVRSKEDICLKLEDMPAFFEGPTLFIGNDFSTQQPVLMSVFGKDARFAPPFFWNLKASALGFVGLKRFREEDFDEPGDLLPLYLRAPDIRPKPNPVPLGIKRFPT